MANFRAKKAGMGLRHQKQQEQRYDAEDSLGTPARIVDWMNTVLDGQHPKCSGTSWRKMQFWMRDGYALCKFINILREKTGMNVVKYNKVNATTPFVAMENIDIFNKAAAEFGVPQEETFQSIDLYEGHKGPFLNVVNCLNRLGFVSNEKGFEPKFEAIEPPSRDGEQWAQT